MSFDEIKYGVWPNLAFDVAKQTVVHLTGFAKLYFSHTTLLTWSPFLDFIIILVSIGTMILWSRLVLDTCVSI